MNTSDFTALSPGHLVPTTGGAMAFVPNPPLRHLNLDVHTTMFYGLAERALGHLRGRAERLLNPTLISSPLLHREAILSSRIEGTITTPEKLVLLEAASEAGHPAPKPDQEAQEVLNYIKAMYHALGRLRGGFPVCLRLLQETHQTLLQGVRGERERPGEFRETQNWIGIHKNDPIERARFVPPPVPEMKAALSDLEEYLHTDLDMPLLVKLALVHYQFETIHPFRDGNGRVGRLLIPLLLCSEKHIEEPLLYLSLFFEKNYDAYVRLLLEVSQKGDWLAWVRFFLKAIVDCSADAIALADQVLRLQAKWHQQFQAARSSALLIKLIDQLLQSPAISIKQAQQVLGVTYTAAWWSIKKLVEGGVLKQLPGIKKNQLFFAPAIIALLNEARTAPAESAHDASKPPEGVEGTT